MNHAMTSLTGSHALRFFLLAVLMQAGLALAQANSALPQAVLPAAAAPASVAPNCPPPAPTLTPEQLKDGMRSAKNHGPMWRIEKDGRTSWLYGTVHAAKLDWLFPGPNIVRALRESDTLAVEINLLDRDSLKPLTQSAPPVDPAAVQSVDDRTQRERLVRLAALACLPAGALDKLSLVMQSIVLTILSARDIGLYADFGSEMVLTNAAQAMKKPIVALETSQSQLDVVSGGSAAAQRAALNDALDLLENGAVLTQIKMLTDAWAAADMAVLEKYPQWCGCMDKPNAAEMMKKMLDDRNGPMADKIGRLHREGQRVFAAIGVLHMIGAQSLPTLLRAQGFDVELVRHDN
jgi:uncharacterized protein